MLLVSCPKFFPTQFKLARAPVSLVGGNGFPRLVYSAIQQHASAANAHVPPPAAHPTGLGHHRARSSRAGQRVPWWCTHVSANSQFVPPSPSPAPFTSPFSTSVSIFLPCKEVHQYHFSRLYIYVLICDICFSLTSLRMTDSRFIHLTTTDSQHFSKGGCFVPPFGIKNNISSCSSQNISFILGPSALHPVVRTHSFRAVCLSQVSSQKQLPLLQLSAADPSPPGRNHWGLLKFQSSSFLDSCMLSSLSHA